MTFEIIIESAVQVSDAAKTILKNCEGRKVFAFTGEMGSGKTTLIKALCKELGVIDKAVSPTFAMVNEYRGAETVFHIDLYRLRDIYEALEIGIEEYLASGSFCFIEWSELIKDLLPTTAVTVVINVEEDGSRRVEVNF